MEGISIFTVVMAIAIGSIIVAISMVKNRKVKTVIYSLPIPLTLTLIASQKGVDASHVVGLFLVVGFLWSVNLLRKLGATIIVADVCSVVMYVFLGYALLQLVTGENLSFTFLTSLFVLAWMLFALFVAYGKYTSKNPPGKRWNVNPLVKGSMITLVAMVLLTFVGLLKGIVVTFPFAGIFAVFEMRNQLDTLATEFTKNSIAILALFIALYLLIPILGMYPAIGIGWAVYTVVLLAVKGVRWAE